MKKHCERHWSIAKKKKNLKYLKGTRDFGLKYLHVGDFSLIIETLTEKENGVSISGYIMSLG